LDNFPNDKNKLDLFNKYNKKSEAMIKEYNMRYEPLTTTDNDFKDIPFAWVDSPWPWEGV
jgi:spore coat protein JB